MNRFAVFFLAAMIPTLVFGQFKSQTDDLNIREAIKRPGSNLLLGILNPEKFHMYHTFSASYMSAGGNGIMMNSYMNTIHYQISTPLFLRLNLGLMYSPYNSFVNNPALNKTQFFGGAELQYRPSENMLFKVGVDVSPFYNYIYAPYPFSR